MGGRVRAKRRQARYRARRRHGEVCLRVWVANQGALEDLLFDAGLLPPLCEPTKSELECGLSLWVAGQVSRITPRNFRTCDDSHQN
jgi:hypothetical protein